MKRVRVDEVPDQAGRVMAKPHEIHVHFLRISGGLFREAAGELSLLLPPEERGRYHRLGLESRKQEFLWSRLFLRQVLSQTLGKDIWNQEFSYQDQGKPYLEASKEQFNLSHTEGAMVCSVGRHSLGIDIEKQDVRARRDWRLVANRYFSPAEKEHLESRPCESQPAVFFQLFTMKEAIVKALGRGIQYPLASFTLPLPVMEFSRLDGLEIFTSTFADIYNFALVVENPHDIQLQYVAHHWKAETLLKALRCHDPSYAFQERPSPRLEKQYPILN